ncbi:NAD(P)/FAD-dependent oxidoreductase [Fodinicola feengrottensis]|uniref:FAD-dependent oxidoreductase n=1 Tax=Fodinicola feengrottensis TaxID=435914 RepID=A0ABN2I7V8_9ACTN|nr:FAD-dependent oxidoreductase [Fodinicola feengrottensis]
MQHYMALAAAAPVPYWLDRAERPKALPALGNRIDCDLAVVGGGFSGLWTALLAKEADPDLAVVLVEGGRLGWAASGRNGGFCEASLTHGEANGRARFPDEYDTLDRLGRENLDDIEKTLLRHGIDCGFERVGSLSVATEPHQVTELEGDGFLDQKAVRAELNSPTFLAGQWEKQGTALVDPARLAWGLAKACQKLGVTIFEHSVVRGMSAGRAGVSLRINDNAVVRAKNVALGTNAFRSPLRRVRPYTVPVYDYVLMTEPLSAERLTSIGWRNRQGVSDSGNQFHYYRLTADNRILWGGYDAIYHFGRKVRPKYDQRPATFERLADHFFETFPQLEGIGFTHRWGGAIDTCSRFCAFFGTAHSGRVAYALGFTGLGVGATRFGARVMLDLLAGQPTELTELRMVRTKPIPFPPEPVAYAGIELTRRSMAKADRDSGRRDLWLRGLDALGMGFDS